MVTQRDKYMSFHSSSLELPMAGSIDKMLLSNSHTSENKSASLMVRRKKTALRILATCMMCCAYLAIPKTGLGGLFSSSSPNDLMRNLAVSIESPSIPQRMAPSAHRSRRPESSARCCRPSVLERRFTRSVRNFARGVAMATVLVPAAPSARGTGRRANGNPVNPSRATSSRHL